MQNQQAAKQQYQDLLGDEQEVNADALWDAIGSYDPAVSPSVDVAWLRLSEQLPVAPAQLVTPVAKKRPAYYRYAIAAAVALIALFAVNTLSRPGNLPHTYANNGEQALQIDLPDASEVAMRPGSELTYQLSGETRVATLNGSAFFEVAKNAEKPFKVVGNGFEVLVVGTQFMVSTGKLAYVSVREGHVRLRGSRQADWVDLYAGDSMLIREQLAIGIDAPLGPQLDLQFNDVSLSDVSNRLAEARVAYIDIPATLALCNVTADFSESSPQDIADALAILFSAKLTTNGDRFVLRGGSCK